MSNPLLDDVNLSLPGITIALPTSGQYYSDDVFSPGTDYNNINVKCLTMVDEIKYRDPFLLSSGQAILSMIRGIAPEVIKVDELCDIDIECIILATRIASYGNMLPIEISCQNPETFDELDPDTDEPTGKKFPVCTHKQEYNIDLMQLIQNYNPIENLDKYQVNILPYNHKVVLKPLSHGASLKMTKSLIGRKRNFDTLSSIISEEDDEYSNKVIVQYNNIVDLSIDMTTELIVDSIFYVESPKHGKIYNKKLIEEWVKVLLPHNIKLINDKVTEFIDDIKKLSCINHTCPKCNHKQEVPIVLDNEKLFLSVAGNSPVQMNSSDILIKKEKIQTKRLKNFPK